MLNYDLVDRRYKKDVNHVQLDPIYEKYYIKRVAQLMSKAQVIFPFPRQSHYPSIINIYFLYTKKQFMGGQYCIIYIYI